MRKLARFYLVPALVPPYGNRHGSFKDVPALVPLVPTTGTTGGAAPLRFVAGASVDAIRRRHLVRGGLSLPGVALGAAPHTAVFDP